jgi:hypothetical protein
MKVWLWSAVHGIMFRRGGDLDIIWIIPLQSLDEGHPQAARQIRVLAVGFLAPAPARIAKDVDVEAPKRQPFLLSVIPVSESFMVFGPGFRGNHICDFAHQFRVPSRCETDGLRKHGRDACPRHSVEAFVSPVVFGNVETGDGPRNVHH